MTSKPINADLPADIAGEPTPPADTSGPKWYTIYTNYLQATGRDDPPTMAGDLCRPDGLAELARFEINQDTIIETPPAVLQVRGVRVLSRGDIAVVTGAAKSRKTLFLASVANYLITGGNGDIYGTETPAARVLWIDTEQSGYHAKLTYNRITKGATADQRARLHFLALREQTSTAERLATLCAAIEQYSPDFVAVDGYADLMANTNDKVEASAIVSLLMAMGSGYDCGIMGVIHTTAANATKGQGHAGSEFERKAETIINVRADKEDPSGRPSIVSAQYTRGLHFDTLQITHTGEDGFTLSIQVKNTATGEDKLRAQFECVKNRLAGEVPEYETAPTWTKTQIAAKLAELTGMSDRTARERVAAAAERGWLTEAGKAGKGASAASLYTFDDWQARRADQLTSGPIEYKD